VNRTYGLHAPRRPSRVRPYGITRGRTAADRFLGVERLISTVEFDPRRVLGMLPETAAVYEACRYPRTIAELATGLVLPLGVIRVLVGDLAAAGRVRIHPQAADMPDRHLLERVLRGLDNL
jgi:hypothetical protein